MKINNQKDECEKCEENYELTGDNLKCLIKLENCLEHQREATNFDSKTHICHKCK